MSDQSIPPEGVYEVDGIPTDPETGAPVQSQKEGNWFKRNWKKVAVGIGGLGLIALGLVAGVKLGSRSEEIEAESPEPEQLPEPESTNHSTPYGYLYGETDDGDNVCLSFDSKEEWDNCVHPIYVTYEVKEVDNASQQEAAVEQ